MSKETFDWCGFIAWPFPEIRRRTASWPPLFQRVVSVVLWPTWLVCVPGTVLTFLYCCGVVRGDWGSMSEDIEPGAVADAPVQSPPPRPIQPPPPPVKVEVTIDDLHTAIDHLNTAIYASNVSAADKRMLAFAKLRADFDGELTREIPIVEALNIENEIFKVTMGEGPVDVDWVSKQLNLAIGTLDRLGKCPEGPMCDLGVELKERLADLKVTLVPAMKAQNERLVREEEAEEALDTLLWQCGEEPSNSGGYVGDVWTFLQANIQVNPDSIKIRDCTDFVLTDQCWVTNCWTTSRNAFNAEIVEYVRFTLGDGGPWDRVTDITVLH